MKTFLEHLNDDPEPLDEGFLRGASALVLMNHIHTQRKRIKQSRKVDHRTIDALASMILVSASLTYAMTQFQSDQKVQK